MLRSFSIIVLAISTLVPEVLAQGEDRPTARISASTDKGFARIAFDLTEAVPGHAQINEHVVVVRFDKPFEVDTETLGGALEPYVALVRQDADGRTLRFALKTPVRLKSLNRGNRLLLDLIPPTFVGDPPADGEGPTNGAQERLTVGVSEHERKTRLQLAFPGKVEHTVTLVEGKLTVRFSKTAEVDLKRFAQAPPARVRAVRSGVTNGRLWLEFDVDRETEFSDLSDADSIVIELSDGPSDHVAAAAAATRAPKVLLPDVIDETAVPPMLVAERIAFALPPRANVRRQIAAIGDAKLHGETTVASGDAATPSLSLIQDDTTTIRVDGVVTPVDPNPLPTALRLGQTELQDVLAQTAVASDAEPGQARAEFFGSLMRLELPYTKLPAAAVFRRGLAIWVIVASVEPMNLSAVEALANAPVRVLSPVTEVAPGITAFRLEAPAAMSVSASAVGNSWVLAVGNTVPDVPAQLQLVRQTSGTNTKLRAYLPGAQQVVWLRDPQTQDRIAVVMSFAPARGLVAARAFVEFAALASPQGLALRAIADDVTVTIEGSEAVIGRPAGLSISDSQFARLIATETPSYSGGKSPAFVDFAAWGKPLAKTKAEAVRHLLRLSAASPGGMSAPRMSLARYYIAEGFAAEALGVLKNVAREDGTADANPSFRVARAVANLLMARSREALTDLSMEALGNDPHAALWRGLAAAGTRDWRLARNNLMTALKVLNHYPPAWQARARTALGMAALALNEPASATEALAGMPHGDAPADVDAAAKLIRAALDVVSNKIDSAIAAYESLSKHPYRPVALRARLEGILLKAEKGKLSPEQAIGALERLRFQWRGDETELKTLTELGKLYVRSNRHRDGLNTMRLAVRHFSNTDEARTTAAQMARIFEDMFLSGKADGLAPLQALALFYDFRELTPVGAQGDEMIRRLADRLVSVDLLPQAAELLQHQVDNRLEGVGRASVATRLALIYMLDRKAEKALAVIRGSKQVQLPDELIAQRNLVEARALSDLRLYDDALDLIATDATPEADRLRADVYWDAQRWPDAAARAEEMLGTRYQDFTPLTSVERTDLMRASVSYALAGDSASLERLRSRFASKMAQSADASAFNVLTQSPDVTGNDFKSLVKHVSSADTLGNFLRNFQTRYGAGDATVSTLVPAATDVAN